MYFNLLLQTFLSYFVEHKSDVKQNECLSNIFHCMDKIRSQSECHSA